MFDKLLISFQRIFVIMLVILFFIPSDKVKAESKIMKATDIYQKCQGSMVEIKIIDQEENEALGSGFFIEEGIILTNYHVIDDAVEIHVFDYAGKEYRVTALYDYDEAIDIAVIGVEDSLPSMDLCKEMPAEGDTVYTIGSPYGYTGTFSKGIISKASRIVDEVLCHQITAPISRGNSGGPLINRSGEVIGINTFVYVNGMHVNFAISIVNLQYLVLDQPTDIEAYYDLNK